MLDQLIVSEKSEKGEEEVNQWIRTHQSDGIIRSVNRIPGDASARRYYRVHTANGSYVLMRMEGFSDQGLTLPFLVVQKHLQAAGVPVPEVYDVDPSKGFILLEDLGDVTLLRHLQEVSSSETEYYLYEKVIDGLIEMQVKASPEARPADIDAYRLRFDEEKLLWEVNFTLEHFYKTYLKRNVSSADQSIMQEGFTKICQHLAAQPTVLTHRDFHSRNVMVKAGDGLKGEEDRLVMIDFQDARMGPKQYDLASLLRDSYYQLEERQIILLVKYYLARWKAMTGEHLDHQEFIYTFDMMSVQRNFKAIGSFASFLNRRGDATYLKYIGNTFENIRRVLLKYPEFTKLREVLFHYYYF